MNYKEKIDKIKKLTFDSIIELNRSLLPLQYHSCAWKYPGLDHGTAVLTTEEQCYAYISAYGEMHQAKINEVLDKINIADFKNTDFKIIDWGCGQGLGTICLFDFFNKHSIKLDLVKKVVLIEPSKIARAKAKIHVNAYLNDEERIDLIGKNIDDVSVDEIFSEEPVTLHLFSNILDIPSIDLLQLANKIKTNLTGLHYFFCWGPLNWGNDRIDSFWNYFNEADTVFSNVHSKLEYNSEGKLTKTFSYTAKNRVFKLNGNECELIFVDFYQPKQFHAAYQLDSVKKALKNKDKLQGLYKNLSEFEVQTPFDIRANVYDDVHPILAVLNNIITRGLPTKASPFIEDAFVEYGNHLQNDSLGGFEYAIDDLNSDDLFLAMHLVDPRWQITKDNYNRSILDSDLEFSYITEKVDPIFRQILLPQRTLSSISSNSLNHSQRVDFAFEFPYGTSNDKGINFQGCVIELDGERYHAKSNQQQIDRQRDQVLNKANWYCIRLKENEIDFPYGYYNHLGSDYVRCCEQVYNKPFDRKWERSLELVLSPIAIARMEKTILEALMTGVLDLSASTWKVLVTEHDVPCAALAFEELQQMFNHIAQLSLEYSDMKFPNVDLTIVCTKEFAESPLHLNHRVLVGEYHSNTEYDMVIDFAMLRRNGLEKIDFTEYRCKNKCYFNVRSAHYHRNNRQIYTSDRILYKPIAIRNSQGRYDDIEENVKHLRYFLQMLFRKQNFRSGQIPILNRALQYKSVIGLLPTGGGKSLTYQIAAMLQPGVTLIIDPLRSLMKDQFDGLNRVGIDCCSYINSSIEVPDEIKAKGNVFIREYRIKERERRSKSLEQSELLFMFLSPERLSILDFRERLKNMQETGVYFSYGVIDEVHCVSEWGHDFRFSYLHLGRNLYKYVLPKPHEGNELENHIPLFGLTATASFDVLADVERELSGNGAFPLDAETTVREGDANRLEIQYKIEQVQISFPERQKDGSIKLDKWAIYDTKKAYLDCLITQMPTYLNELLTAESIKTITDGYKTGPRADGRELNSLQTDIPADFFSVQDSYNYGGIVFCPHKDKTGIAVFTNKNELCTLHPHLHTLIGTFVGSSDDESVNAILNANQVDESFENLELFRNNKIPLMIATKAFGMGIDKPNVRFTVNLNYSSSLESYVQEAGRAGRDRRMALSVIMLSHYRIARVKPDSNYYSAYRNKWFDANDIDKIAQKEGIPVKDFEICDETSDLIKLKCKQCGDSCKRFERNCCRFSCNHCNKPQKDETYRRICSQGCEYVDTCPLAKVAEGDRWANYNHLSSYKKEYPFITNENYEFLNADYETVMFFYNNNFKGEYHEKLKMNQLLSTREMEVSVDDGLGAVGNTIPGFLTTLQAVSIGAKVVSYISYKPDEYADIAKAIYRMCCIDLVDDFTQDYNSKRFRIVSQKKKDGQYYEALERFLRRYYTSERATEVIHDVPSYKGDNEIQKCLGFLTHFIYDKIAVKRKRAIDDMFSFCIHGVNKGKDWKEINEELKDELYFYFNSKYARREYTTESGEPFSLIVETEDGKRATWDTVQKFMKVVDSQWISKNSEAGSTQIDNAKHLYGAVRLIRRSVTDINPALDLLGAFCLMFLGTNNNPVLQQELENLYISGMVEFHRRDDIKCFWNRIFNGFNSDPNVSLYFTNKGILLKSSVMIEIHKNELAIIKNKYLN